MQQWTYAIYVVPVVETTQTEVVCSGHIFSCGLVHLRLISFFLCKNALVTDELKCTSN